jgi:hypothetical protein
MFGYHTISKLGTFVLWVLKRGKIKFSECEENSYTYLIGLLFILLIVITLGGTII